MDGIGQRSGRRWNRRLLAIGFVVVSIILCAGNLGPRSVATDQGTFSPALQQGDFVGFSCAHAAIWLNSGSSNISVCHDKTNQQVGVALGGVSSYSMFAALDSGYGFTSWTASGHTASCLGSYPTCGTSSGTNPVPFWGSCAFGQHCSGTLTLTSYLIPTDQVLTAQIYGGAGQIILNGQTLTSGEQLTLGSGSVVSVSALNIPSGYTFWGWVSDDGTFQSASSSSTQFTVGEDKSGVGNVSLVLLYGGTAGNNWGGLVMGGTSYTQVSATVTVPTSVSYVSYRGDDICLSSLDAPYCPEILGYWIGIGGFLGTNLWQAGYFITAFPYTGADSVQLFYEAVGSGGTPQAVLGPTISFGATLSIVTSFDPITQDDSFQISCVGSPCSGLSQPWGLTYDSFVPDTAYADFVVEIGGTAGPTASVTFSSPSTVDSGVVANTFAQPDLVLALDVSAAGEVYTVSQLTGTTCAEGG